MERDAALGRLGRTRRWLIIGAAALSAGFAALVSAIAPGRSLGHTRQASANAANAKRTTVHSTATMPPLASPSDLGLQGPSQAPQSTQSQSPSQPAPQQQAAPQPQAAPTPAPAPEPAPAVSGGS